MLYIELQHSCHSMAMEERNESKIKVLSFTAITVWQIHYYYDSQVISEWVSGAECKLFGWSDNGSVGQSVSYLGDQIMGQWGKV